MKSRLWGGTLLGWMLISNVALSCPVCYGQSDSNTATAVNASVIVLLLFTGAVLSMFGSLFLYLRKRMKLAADNNSQTQH